MYVLYSLELSNPYDLVVHVLELVHLKLMYLSLTLNSNLELILWLVIFHGCPLSNYVTFCHFISVFWPSVVPLICFTAQKFSSYYSCPMILDSG